jgi:hypothetical protein
MLFRERIVDIGFAALEKHADPSGTAAGRDESLERIYLADQVANGLIDGAFWRQIMVLANWSVQLRQNVLFASFETACHRRNVLTAGDISVL